MIDPKRQRGALMFGASKAVRHASELLTQVRNTLEPGHLDTDRLGTTIALLDSVAERLGEAAKSGDVSDLFKLT